MTKFDINDEVYLAGRWGAKTPIYVWKINRKKDGSITYTCSADKGRNEKVYTDKEIYYLSELF